MFSGGHDCISTNDIILADFWGYKQLENQQQIDDKGTSLIMANTQKGIDFVKMSEDELICTQLPLEYISYAFKSGNDLIGKKQKFLSLYERYGFEKAAKKAYMSGCLKFRVKKFIKRVIGK